MSVFDLDALVPKPVRVRFNGKEYDVQRSLPVAKALELAGLVQQATQAGTFEQQSQTLQGLVREAAALMTDDPDEREAIARAMTAEQAAHVIGIALGRIQAGQAVGDGADPTGSASG